MLNSVRKIPAFILAALLSFGCGRNLEFGSAGGNSLAGWETQFGSLNGNLTSLLTGSSSNQPSLEYDQSYLAQNPYQYLYQILPPQPPEEVRAVILAGDYRLAFAPANVGASMGLPYQVFLGPNVTLIPGTGCAVDTAGIFTGPISFCLRFALPPTPAATFVQLQLGSNNGTLTRVVRVLVLPPPNLELAEAVAPVKVSQSYSVANGALMNPALFTAPGRFVIKGLSANGTPIAITGVLPAVPYVAEGSNFAFSPTTPGVYQVTGLLGSSVVRTTVSVGVDKRVQAGEAGGGDLSLEPSDAGYLICTNTTSQTQTLVVDTEVGAVVTPNSLSLAAGASSLPLRMVMKSNADPYIYFTLHGNALYGNGVLCNFKTRENDDPNNVRTNVTISAASN